ncbi:MAG TPA: formimidoylglutamate deiminase [Casimicrobiaceae bacterium]|nr:formimidoylglutamate deiminase [Casimicrobiaceae bacterium]
MSADQTQRKLWAPRAWLMRDGVGSFQEGVELGIDARGYWSSIATHAACPPSAERLDGPILPGMVDAHSHAFQRAFAGLAERRDASDDDFWSWRDRMYRVALQIEPDMLEAIASQLYVELLCGGYTDVCEFHYLHHASDGSSYTDPLAMCRALANAATRTGIGLTILPVLYERAGFMQPLLRDDQRRFATNVERVLKLRDGVRAMDLPLVKAGTAVHSLRAAQPVSIAGLQAALAGDRAPIHIHVSEQQREVDECVAATRMRPIEWLAEHVALDSRWQLVHATHATIEEINAVARAGAGIVLCPTTEANLGDGVPDLPRWLDAGVPIALGSDSNVTRDWPDEIRHLEYAQRLQLQARNVGARPHRGSPSTAETLLAQALDGGRHAAGRVAWGFEVGARADLVVLDESSEALMGVPPQLAIDALTFSGPSRPFRHVMVAGEWRIRDGRSQDEAAIAAAFRQAMRVLWSD